MISTLTQSVLNNIVLSASAGSLGGVEGGSISNCTQSNAGGLQLSGDFKPQGCFTLSADPTIGSTIITTAHTQVGWEGTNLQDGYTWVTAPWTGDDTYNVPITTPNTVPNDSGLYIPGYILQPQPFITNYPPISIVSDLDLLEEGVYDIKGGKILIKKIKVTEEQLDQALELELGRQATDEEKTRLHEDLIEIANSEEREV